MAKTKFKDIKKAFKTAFPYTIPILAGFLFLGFAYGVLMNVSGFGFLYPLFMSITILAGSMEFVAVDILLAAFNHVQTFVLTVMINARHLFYGLSMLDKFKNTGLKKFYLIFGMCDETFSINFTANIPKDVDKGWFMFFVTILDHLYWVTGSVLGGIFGSFITFDTDGISFVMTSMFVVIFLEQFLKEKNHFPSYIGLAISALCLLIFGADNFIIPSMAAILAILTIFGNRIEKNDNGGNSGKSATVEKIEKIEKAGITEKGGDAV